MFTKLGETKSVVFYKGGDDHNLFFIMALSFPIKENYVFPCVIICVVVSGLCAFKFGLIYCGAIAVDTAYLSWLGS